MNAIRGTLKIAAIKAPNYGEERRSTLDDLAMSIGATLITRESGIKLAEIEMKHLGSAKFIESSKHYTTIVGGDCDVETIGARIETMKASIEQTESLQEAEQIQNRIVRLASGVAVIRVGGSTEVEMTERKHRIEDALEAVKSAQEEGIVAGGGTALLRASRSIAVISEDGTSDQGYGAVVIQKACEEPIRQMAINAGGSPDLIVSQVLASDNNTGWNFRTNEMVNLMDTGVIDPVKVTRVALQNAASCAGTLITTNFGIIQTE
jgi:chaperonin GroEL